MNNNIYLVGFMGTGKTAAGKLLAKKNKWQFVDLDELIELKEKRRICDIFAQDGEPYFRRLEKRALKEVAKEKKFVVACGGGIVIDPENIKIMKASGTVVCLAARPEVILERTCGSSARPLLNVADPKKQIELLLKLRAPYYAKADKMIDTSKLTVEKVKDKISQLTKSSVKKRSVPKVGRIIFLTALLASFAFCAFAQKVPWQIEEYVDNYVEFYYQGRYSDALDTAEEALKYIEKQYGVGHLNTAVSLNNVATLNKILKKYPEAEQLYKRARDIFEENLGPDNFYTAKMINNSAEVYFLRRKLKEAEKMFNEAESIIRQGSGIWHPEVARIINNLGLVFKEQRKYDDAELYYKRAIDVVSNTMGPQHPYVIKIYSNLGALYQAQRKYNEAEQMYKKALEIFKADFTREAPDEEGTLNRLKSEQQNLWSQTNQPLYQRIMDINDSYDLYVDPFQPEVIKFLEALPALYSSQKRYAEAGLTYESELQIMMNNVGSEHPNIALLLDSMSRFYRKTGNTAKADDYQQKAERIRSKKPY